MFLISTVLVAIVGYIVKEPIKVIKPLGDIFYRLLFMVGPALVFFSFPRVINKRIAQFR
jgi:Na+/H+-dicarboxylate symporter